jgi:F-type H+-transporting ATPase subunit delta
MAEAATIARPYAKAAFMSARDAKVLGAWSEALQKSAGLVADARIADLISNPKLSVDQVVSMFAGLGGSASGDMDTHWQNFVRLLTQNKRLEVLPEIAAQFEMLKAEFENELDVQVTSAVEMNTQQQAKLADALKKRFKRDVRISSVVDPSLLGGAVIRAGDLVIDGSINGRLQRMASDLAN